MSAKFFGSQQPKLSVFGKFLGRMAALQKSMAKTHWYSPLITFEWNTQRNRENNGMKSIESQISHWLRMVTILSASYHQESPIGVETGERCRGREGGTNRETKPWWESNRRTFNFQQLYTQQLSEPTGLQVLEFLRQQWNVFVCGAWVLEAPVIFWPCFAVLRC